MGTLKIETLARLNENPWKGRGVEVPEAHRMVVEARLILGWKWTLWVKTRGGEGRRDSVEVVTVTPPTWDWNDDDDVLECNCSCNVKGLAQ